MRAITICQPYAHLIAIGEKSVENRTWATDHRGLLAIHAGKGRDYLDEDDLEKWPGMAFGAVVAVANLAGCVQLDRSRVALSGLRINGVDFPPVENETFTVPDWAKRRWPWLAGHQHTEGPVAWVLTEVRALPVPVPCRGAQGLWDVPADVLAKVTDQLRQLEVSR